MALYQAEADEKGLFATRIKSTVDYSFVFGVGCTYRVDTQCDEKVVHGTLS